MTDYYAVPNTAKYVATKVAVSALVSAFQVSAFQEDAFQAFLGADFTALTAEPNVAHYYVEQR